MTCASSGSLVSNLIISYFSTSFSQSLFKEYWTFLCAQKQLCCTYHVCAIDRGGHLDLPEVLPLSQLLVAADGSGAAAVLHVEVHLAVVTCQLRGR